MYVHRNWRSYHILTKLTSCNVVLLFFCFLQYRDATAISGHNHKPDPSEEEVVKMHVRIRERAGESTASPVNVIATALINVSDGAKASAGKLETIKRDVRRLRTIKYPPNPKTVEEWEIPEEWKSTGGSYPRNFLIHDWSRVRIETLCFRYRRWIEAFISLQGTVYGWDL